MTDLTQLSATNLRALLDSPLIAERAKQNVRVELDRRAPEKTNTRKQPNEDRYKSQAERDMAAMLGRDLAEGRIAGWAYEVVTFRLGLDVRYTPDFFIRHHTGPPELREVKGEHAWRASMVKFRVALEAHPEYRWSFWRKHLKRNGGHWSMEWPK
jgi:hypothetical protein